VASYEEMTIKIQKNRKKKKRTRIKGENKALRLIELRVKVKAN